MVRIKSSVQRHKRKKRLLKQAKGQFGQRSKRFAQAKRSVVKGLAYAFRDRKARKREYRHLWVIRINAACRELGISYSRFIKGLTSANVSINRKVLAELAVNAPEAFQELVKVAQQVPASPAGAKSAKT